MLNVPASKATSFIGLKDDPQFELTPEQLHWEHQEAEVINLLDSADQEFCQIPGNQQYQPFEDVWHDATANFIREADKRLQEEYTAEQLTALQQLTSSQWQNFEQKFTGWLKQNNETDAVISAEIAAILHS